MPREFERDPVNSAAAAQEAEMRKLQRKKQLHKSASGDDSGSGVYFEETLTDEEIMQEALEADPHADIKDLENSSEKSFETSSKNVSRIPNEKNSSQKMKIEISTDGVWENTSIKINGRVLNSPVVKIFLSKENISVKALEEVDLI